MSNNDETRWMFEVILRRLARIETLGILHLYQGAEIMAELDDLETSVRAMTDAQASAVTLIKGLADRLTQASQDPKRIGALATQLRVSAEALAEAVVANTPAAPVPAPS